MKLMDYRYRSVYQYGCEQLMKAEVPEHELDARLLLEYVCGTDRNTLFIHPDLEVDADKAKEYASLIEKRSKRVPLQHLTGRQDFMGLQFKVNEHVLIPRQDTEILVEEAMKYLHEGMRVLDMCTGSGCILLSLLHYTNDCTGVGVDISEQALHVAEENASFLGLVDRAGFILGNLFEKVDGRFDLIVSNPPYIATEEIEKLMPEVRDHEPRLALDGTEDGLYFYRKIIEDSRGFLLPGGYLVFEIGYDQAQAVSELMRHAGFKEVTTYRDYAGLDRVISGYKGILS